MQCKDSNVHKVVVLEACKRDHVVSGEDGGDAGTVVWATTKHTCHQVKVTERLGLGSQKASVDLGQSFCISGLRL